MRYKIAEFLAESMDAEIEEEYFDKILDKYTFALIFDEFNRQEFIDFVQNELEDDPKLLDIFLEDDFIAPLYGSGGDFEFKDQNYILHLKEDHEGIDIIVY